MKRLSMKLKREDGAKVIREGRTQKIKLIKFNGEIDLTIDGWYVLTIKRNGTIRRCKNIPGDVIGFPVDDQGRIEFVQED